MEILSVSMDKEELKLLELTQKRLGYKSRSKMLRAALESLIKDYGTLDSLTGKVESVFVLTYHDKEKNNVSDILHRFESDINTEMHHHHSSTCIDILSLHASAETTRRFFAAVKSSKAIGSVMYSIVSEKQ